jgi:hypothetical protein
VYAYGGREQSVGGKHFPTSTRLLAYRQGGGYGDLMGIVNVLRTEEYLKVALVG